MKDIIETVLMVIFLISCIVVIVCIFWIVWDESFMVFKIGSTALIVAILLKAAIQTMNDE